MNRRRGEKNPKNTPRNSYPMPVTRVRRLIEALVSSCRIYKNKTTQPKSFFAPFAINKKKSLEKTKRLSRAPVWSFTTSHRKTVPRVLRRIAITPRITSLKTVQLSTLRRTAGLKRKTPRPSRDRTPLPTEDPRVPIT